MHSLRNASIPYNKKKVGKTSKLEIVESKMHPTPLQSGIGKKQAFPRDLLKLT